MNDRISLKVIAVLREERKKEGHLELDREKTERWNSDGGKGFEQFQGQDEEWKE
jgi:hypothetical protein